MEDNNKLHYGLSLRLYFEEKAFGPGLVALLRAVEKTGSLQRAARSMNMAYRRKRRRRFYPYASGEGADGSLFKLPKGCRGGTGPSV